MLQQKQEIHLLLRPQVERKQDIVEMVMQELPWLNNKIEIRETTF